MQEQKLLKRKRKAECDGNKSELASICIDLAELYVSDDRYEEAIEEYIIVANVYKQMGKLIDYARANRGIGEAYINLHEYDKALRYQQIYLGIATKEKDKLEEQRALATIGHIYLTQYLDETDKPNQNALNLAYKSFTESLLICESLTGLKKYEHKDMTARLLANLGLVQECRGNYDTAIELLDKSIAICKNHDLFEQLHRGYICMGTLYTHKKEYDEAIRQYNLAFEVAERLKNKIPLMCESLSAKADILIKLADFHSAKYILLKAHKLKHPNLNNREHIEQSLKIVVAMCRTEDSLLATGNYDFVTKKALYEKLGDGACHLRNFSCALEYYQKMLEAARNNNEFGVELSPCYISLAETYRDNKQFEMAIKYFREDFNILRDDHKDGINTLLNIAECMDAADCNLSEIENTFNEATSMCKATADEQMECKVLVNYISVLKKHAQSHKVAELEQRIKHLDHLVTESDTESQTTPNIGDDVSLDDITDVSDESECENRPTRRCTKGVMVKRNNKGETQLHTACINGNVELVRRLLDQGHPVNPRDNCGWLPIHEACICGHLEIVEMLIVKGAAINDRGGTLCQGITPLHDAALNGHLEVLQLLLNKGGSSTVKNDNGEIPLQVLKTWRASQNLNHEEQMLYDSLIQRLTCDAEKLGLSKNLSSNNNSSAIILEEEPEKISPKPRKAKNTKIGNLRKNLSFDDDLDTTSLKESESSQTVKDEYKRVMKNLRHPAWDEEVDKKRKSKEINQKPAYVEADFGDDWLDDDIPSTSKKRRTGSGDGFLNTMTVREKSSTPLHRHNSFSGVKCAASYKDSDAEKPNEFLESDFRFAPDLTNGDNYINIHTAQNRRTKKKTNFFN